MVPLPFDQIPDRQDQRDTTRDLKAATYLARIPGMKDGSIDAIRYYANTLRRCAAREGKIAKWGRDSDDSIGVFVESQKQAWLTISLESGPIARQLKNRRLP